MVKPVWLCASCECREDSDYGVGSIAMDGICCRCSGLAQVVFEDTCQEPRQAFDTWLLPLAFTTCVTVQRYQPVVWDVNGYYRDLGVSPDATRRHIREAYQHARGWESERLTYVVKQLLNPQTRASYDAVPIGSIFFDRYLLERVNRRIEDDLRSFMEGGGSLGDTERVDIDHLVGRPIEVLDSKTSERDDVSHSNPIWGWAYYLWQSGCRDVSRLARWQEHLVAAMAEIGEVRHIGVGFLGRHMECAWEIIEVRHLPVILLNDGQRPSAALAREAVDRVVHNRESHLV